MKAEVEIEENEDVLAKHCVDIDIEQIFGVMLIAAFLALSERATREDYSDKGKEEDKWSCGGKGPQLQVPCSAHFRGVGHKLI